jgi:RimJ/RimL family protein N-acetyltransferase
MAAFTTKDPSDESAFTAHWKRITADESIIIKTILYHKQVVGHVLSFEQFGAREVSYWIVKEHWGKGIATRALENFLEQVNTRPLFARAAKDNTASIRVLEKCGFTITGEDKGYSNARNKEVEEYILVLDENEVKMT